MRLLILALAFIGSLSPALADEASDAAQAVIGGQIDAFRAKRHEQAFSYAAPQLKLMFRDTGNFIAMVKRGYEPIYGAQNYSFGRTKVEGSATLYQEVLLTGPAGRSWVALYTMKQDKDGVWKIAGVRLVPGGGQTT